MNKSCNEDNKISHVLNLEKTRLAFNQLIFSKKKIKVLVDPGHLGGQYATLEKRIFYLDSIKKSYLAEGDLTLRVFQELKKISENNSKIQLINSRDMDDIGLAINEIIEKDLIEDAWGRLIESNYYKNILKPLESDKNNYLKFNYAFKLHAFNHYFSFLILKNRILKNNIYDPDLLISIHFNAGEKEKLFLVSMIKGNIPTKRLYNDFWRFRLIRDSYQHQEFYSSYFLAQRINKNLSKMLELPYADSNFYEDHLSIEDSDNGYVGVDSWNGILFRYTDYPSVLIEGPHYDDPDFSKILYNDLKLEIGDEKSIFYQYAKAIYDGLLENPVQ